MSTMARSDARSHVSATATLAAIEGRLLLRDPASLFTVAIPVFLLVVFGASSRAGATAVLPTTLATAIGLFGLYLVPTTLATYRERGILRRLSVTPLPPARLLGVQLLLQTAARSRELHASRRGGRGDGGDAPGRRARRSPPPSCWGSRASSPAVS